MARRAYPSHFQAALDAAAEVQDTRPRIARIEIVLPFPPSANNLYPTIVVKGRAVRVPSTALKHYHKAVSDTLGAWLAQRGCRPPAPPYRLTLQVYPPNDKRKHDASNLVKAPEDALMKAISGDDNDVVELHAYKLPIDAWPRVVVTLEGEV